MQAHSRFGLRAGGGVPLLARPAVAEHGWTSHPCHQCAPAAAEGETRTSSELDPLRYVEDDESHVDIAVGRAHATKLFANRRGASAGLSRIERSGLVC